MQTLCHASVNNELCAPPPLAVPTAVLVITNAVGPRRNELSPAALQRRHPAHYPT
jgi:hypothetical protein